MMSNKKVDKPQALACGRIPTLNQRGFTTEILDPLSLQFVNFTRNTLDEVVDIGCAYGIVVKHVLAEGGRVCACDMDLRHLDFLLQSVSPTDQPRLRCVEGVLPDIDFAANAFGAILCSRVLHFLTGTEVEVSISKMHRWLKPGGKLFLSVDTPYSGAARDAIIPEYERNKLRGDLWPGFMPDFERFLSPDSTTKFSTSFIHLMDPDTLVKTCQKAGFKIESFGFMARVANMLHAEQLGRDHATVVAVKI